MHRLFQAGAGEQRAQGRHNLHPIRKRFRKTRNSRYQVNGISENSKRKDLYDFRAVSAILKIGILCEAALR
jgi:hypothetical protein